MTAARGSDEASEIYAALRRVGAGFSSFRKAMDQATAKVAAASPVCACGHAAEWHSHAGAGDCEHDGECECRAFAAPSAIQCAAYIGRAHGRCPNMGLRQHDELIDADGTGRMVWVSWCAFHKRWNEGHRGS